MCFESFCLFENVFTQRDVGCGSASRACSRFPGDGVGVPLSCGAVVWSWRSVFPAAVGFRLLLLLFSLSEHHRCE